MEIPESAVKSWRCNANAARGASPAPVTTSEDQEKKLPAAKPESALSAIKIKIEIKEGKRAKIRQINLVGDTRYKQKEILDTLELKTPNWLSWYKQDDRYSRETLQGDLQFGPQGARGFTVVLQLAEVR